MANPPSFAIHSRIRREPHQSADVIIYAVFIIHYLCAALFPPAMAFIPHLTCMCCIVSACFATGKYFERLALTGLALAALVLPTTGIRDSAWLLYLILTYFAYWTIFHRRAINPRIIDHLTYGCIASAAIWQFVPVTLIAALPDGQSQNPIALLPSEANGYRINIGPPGSTVHFTGALAFLGLILAFRNIRSDGRVRDWIAASCHSYLLIFCGVRATLLAAFLMSPVLLCNPSHPGRTSSFRVIAAFGICLGLLAVYLSPFVDISTFDKLTPIAQELTKSNNQDFTSGRSWLWGYHIEQFLTHPLGASSRELRSLAIGDTLGDAQVSAAAESFFTYLLAVFGVFAIIVFACYVKMFSWIGTHRGPYHLAIFSGSIIATAASSVYGYIYGIFVLLAVALVSAEWKHEREPATPIAHSVE